MFLWTRLNAITHKLRFRNDTPRNRNFVGEGHDDAFLFPALGPLGKANASTS